MEDEELRTALIVLDLLQHGEWDQDARPWPPEGAVDSGPLSQGQIQAMAKSFWRTYHEERHGTPYPESGN